MKKIILWIVVITVIVAVIFFGYEFYYKNFGRTRIQRNFCR